ncbi:hypothetical protein AA102526_0945 [Asaia lannensis NBRC 102526]|nr:hypothetical protein AA102526_0945 [Asaia lannensis NBRC 102526]
MGAPDGRERSEKKGKKSDPVETDHGWGQWGQLVRQNQTPHTTDESRNKNKEIEKQTVAQAMKRSGSLGEQSKKSPSQTAEKRKAEKSCAIPTKTGGLAVSRNR